MLEARIDDSTTISVAPIHEDTYSEYIEDDNLGGCMGYFVLRSSKEKSQPKFEVLAKATSFESASEIFRMITAQ